MQQLAFSLYMIVLAPGGSTPVVMNTGRWATQADCKERGRGCVHAQQQATGAATVNLVCLRPRSGRSTAGHKVGPSISLKPRPFCLTPGKLNDIALSFPESIVEHVSVPLPHVPRFQKQSVFNLIGCRFDIAAALGNEDHQLHGMLPRTTLLDMLRLLRDERSHVAERDKPGAVLEHNQAGEFRRPSPGALHGLGLARVRGSVRALLRRAQQDEEPVRAAI
jgi:hypothetical protein